MVPSARCRLDRSLCSTREEINPLDGNVTVAIRVDHAVMLEVKKTSVKLKSCLDESRSEGHMRRSIFNMYLI